MEKFLFSPFELMLPETETLESKFILINNYGHNGRFEV